MGTLLAGVRDASSAVTENLRGEEGPDSAPIGRMGVGATNSGRCIVVREKFGCREFGLCGVEGGGSKDPKESSGRGCEDCPSGSSLEPSVGSKRAKTSAD